MNKRFRFCAALLLALCCLLGAAMAESGRVVLPASLTTVGEEAFIGCSSVQEIVLEEGITAIKSRAFAGIGAQEITLPRSLTDIADDAFAGADGMTVYVYADSYAQAWCERNSRPCKLVGSDEAKASLAYAEVNPLDGTIFGVLANAFKQKAEELSGGSVEIVLLGGGVMGSEETIMRNLKDGGSITDLCRISAFAPVEFGGVKTSLLTLPYTFVSEEHFRSFAESDLARQFLLEPQEVGMKLRGLCYANEGFRHFFFRSSVKSIADMEGLTIRVSTDPVIMDMVERLGATPTYLRYSQLYEALESGELDGTEQPILFYQSNGFDEVAPYLLLDGHTLGMVEIVISDQAWAKLSEKQQRWVEQAAQYASRVFDAQNAADEALALAALTDKGVTVTAVDDKSPFVEACRDLISTNIPDGLAALYQQIIDLK